MQSQTFKKLKAQWDKRLEQSGFKDIESAHGRLTDHQNVADFSQRIGFKQDLYEQVRDYFYWASAQLHGRIFKTKEDKRIWRRYANGISCRKTAEQIDRNHSYVSRRIKLIRKYLYFQERWSPKKGQLRGRMGIESDIVIRHSNAQDFNCISDNWGSSYFKGSIAAQYLTPDEFHGFHRPIRERILQKENVAVLVAASNDDPWLILGWICVETLASAQVLHYLYVKAAFRGHGIASMLMSKALVSRPIIYTHETEKAQKIMEKKKLKDFVNIPNLV